VHYSTSESLTSTVDHSHTCLRCGAIDTPAIGPGKGPHWRSARCRHCGAWLGWLSRRTPLEREAQRQAARAEAMGRKPSSPMQLAYLQALGYAGTGPVMMLEASTLLDSLLQKSQAPDNCIEDSVP
jgi:hypothetical protein